MLIERRITEILSTRSEPTPGILLYNLIDELLIEKNLFPLNDPKRMTLILDNLIDKKIFYLNELNEWWFGKNYKPKLSVRPLTERVIDYIDKNINLEVMQTYSDIYNAIYKEFNDFLTPDRKKISEIIDRLIKKKK